MSEYTVVLVALLFVTVVFIFAMHRGVVKLLSSGLAAAISLVLIFSVIHLLPSLVKTLLDIDLPWQATVTVAATLGFIAYVICLVILVMSLKVVFNPDHWCHRFVDGIPGGILSLFPGLVAVFFLFTCVRVAGTLQELNYVDSLAREGITEMGGHIPGFPISAAWRNGVETIPLVAEFLDRVDPFSNRGNRNAAALVLISRSTALKAYLSTLPETADLVEMKKWRDLLPSPGIDAAIQLLDRVELVTDPVLQAAAADPTVAAELEKLILKPALEGFVGSIPPRPQEIPR